MPTRWSVDIEIGWHPILTFERRRLVLLDWFEEHVNYSGFQDKPDAVGLAVASMDARLTFRRGGLTMNLNGPGRDVADLLEALRGGLAVLEPKHPKLLYIRSGWAEPLEGNYDDLCRRFGSQMAIGLEAGEFWASDASSLVDFVTPQAQLQCEFGIVTRDELARRLQEPGLSRLRTAAQPAVVSDPEELPDLSMYGGITWVPLDVVRIRQPSDVQEATTSALDESGRLLAALASRFVHEFGGRG
jgi:hypothetical protein